MKYKNVSAVILAGGKSSRMGQDKSLMDFNQEKSMAQYLYEKLEKIFEDVYISSKEDKFDFLASKQNLILDSSDIFSPMVALESIFTTIDKQKIFIITVDMPLILSESIIKLLEDSNNSLYEIVIVKDKDNNIHNLCGVFDKSVLNKIEQYIKDDIHKINYLIKNSRHKIIKFDSREEFLNLNTPQEYQKALQVKNKFN
ncbi:MAG: molybdenum cofactor guanylyltransferase MobA [Campylobacterota bacterium]|nr:molybdenum cofactor guanylyltransferase MobA [Campylobacterota bacterium]